MHASAPHPYPFDSQALVAVHESFKLRFAQLWAAAASALATPGAAMPQIVADAPGDRRFSSAGLARAAFLRVGQAVVPALWRIPESDRVAGDASGGGKAPARILGAAVRRRDRADELSRDESRRAEPRVGDRRRQCRRGAQQLCRRRRQGPDHDERRVGICARPQPRRHARQRRLPQRADRAPAVRRDDGEGGEATAADRAAVHQQVLHPRPATGELVRPPRGRAGPYGVHDLVAQRSGRARPPDVGRLPAAGCAGRDGRGTLDRRIANASMHWDSVSAARCSRVRSPFWQRAKKRELPARRS